MCDVFVCLVKQKPTHLQYEALLRSAVKLEITANRCDAFWYLRAPPILFLLCHSFNCTYFCAWRLLVADSWTYLLACRLCIEWFFYFLCFTRFSCLILNSGKSYLSGFVCRCSVFHRFPIVLEIVCCLFLLYYNSFILYEGFFFGNFCYLHVFFVL